MSQADRFALLLEELERVGVDPNTISAGLAVRPEEVLRALAGLPNDAGPEAFLSRLRLVMSEASTTQSDGQGDQTN